MKTPSDDDELRELVRAGPAGDVDVPEAVAHLLAQSNREAVASRAQARELVKALDGIQRSQEYLGTALRQERAKTRTLFILLLLAPAAAAAGAWGVWRHVDATRADLTERLVQLAADGETARAQDAARLRDRRVTELATDLDAFRRDLDASRDVIAAERRHAAEREAALTAAESRTGAVRSEIGALEFEVKAAQSKASAEAARAAHLEKRIDELTSQLDAARKAPAAPAAPPAAAAVPGAAPGAKAPAKETPVTDGAAVERVRESLNGLLAESGDAVRYRIAWLGGFVGRSLTDVKLVGADADGAVVRTIEAARAELVLDPPSRSVVIRFFDGRLVVGKVSAPFYDGTYGLIVRGDPARWKASGLDCVKSD